MFHIERDGHHSNYTCISNAVLRDERLSFEVMAFMVKILSLPDDWSFSVKGIAKICKVGERTVYRYFKELEECGYLRKERIKDERGCFVDTSYFFTENPVGSSVFAQQNAAIAYGGKDEHRSALNVGGQSATDLIAINDIMEQNPPDKTVQMEQPCDISVHTEKIRTTEPSEPLAITEQTADSPSAISPQVASDTQINNNIIINKKRLDLIDQQINGEILRKEFGGYYIDKVVEVITDCMKAKSRTISGDTVDNSELVRVFGEVCEMDIRKAIQAVKGKRFDNFAGYFGSVLFNQIRNRLDKPQLQPQIQTQPKRDFAASSINMDEVMSDVMAKYL